MRMCVCVSKNNPHISIKLNACPFLINFYMFFWCSFIFFLGQKPRINFLPALLFIMIIFLCCYWEASIRYLPAATHEDKTRTNISHFIQQRGMNVALLTSNLAENMLICDSEKNINLHKNTKVHQIIELSYPITSNTKKNQASSWDVQVRDVRVFNLIRYKSCQENQT